LVESCLGLDEVFGTLQTGDGGRGYRLLGFVGKLVNLISNHTHTQAGSHVTATEVLRGCLSKFVSVRQLQEFLRAPFVGILRAYRLSQLVAVGLVSTSAILGCTAATLALLPQNSLHIGAEILLQ